MEQYIPKSVVEAEIERRLEFVEKRLKRNNSYTEEGNIAWERDKALYDAYNSLLHSFDTLEVKEGNLDKECKEFIEEYPIHSKLANPIAVKAIAKHFFELGLKAQKGE